jgi:Malectin domain/Prolyl oligopeptidase family
MNKITVLGFFLLVFQLPQNSLAESSVRIHAGGGAFTDDAGNAWAADNYFNTGAAYATSAPIDGTVNDALYQSERYDLAGGSELTYSIPVTPGTYKVRLHFAEIFFTAAAQRVFDVSIENQIAFANLDIFAEAGAKNQALVKEYTLAVSDSLLSITLIHKIENPKIAAIEVLPGDPGALGAPAVPTAPVISAALVTPVAAASGCIDGKWDPAYTWVKDCTPGSPYDGLYGTGTGTTVFSGATTIYAGAVAHTLSWKLHYFKGNLSGALSGAKLPLIVGLHSWSDGTTLPNLLNIESSLMEYEGGWEDVLFLTVALENGNDLNTWWDGSKVNGVPTTWVMDAIVDLVKARIGDATTLLAGAGAAGLASKTVDANRVYLAGASMGGSGTYHIGIRHPELFAAIHANAGFADYDGGPCGTEAFCTSFTNDFIGTVAENLQMKGLDGKNYPARSYANMSWFVGTHNGASWSAANGGRKYEPPYVLMTHGKADDAVNISSVNRLMAALQAKRFGFSYQRHTGGHSGENFLHLDWLLGFRKDQSYLAFTNNSTDVTTGGEEYNFLDQIGWIPSTIKDETNNYEIKLTGTGTVDVTLHRLQNFVVQPNKGFRFWLNTTAGAGTVATSDANGALTLPKVAVTGATTLLIVKPDSNSPLIIVPSRGLKIRKHGKFPHADGQMLFPSQSKVGSDPDARTETDGGLVNGLGRLRVPADSHSASSY